LPNTPQKRQAREKKEKGKRGEGSAKEASGVYQLLHTNVEKKQKTKPVRKKGQETRRGDLEV
jgi:hypothetical protein